MEPKIMAGLDRVGQMTARSLSLEAMAGWSQVGGAEAKAELSVHPNDWLSIYGLAGYSQNRGAEVGAGVRGTWKF